MALLGLGVGLNMQTLTLAMQNSVPRSEMGVATASSTFFRQIGGTLGVAAFLSILYSVLPTELGTRLAAAASDPDFQSAAAADPGGARLLGGPGLVNDTGALYRLSPALAQPWREVGIRRRACRSPIIGQPRRIPPPGVSDLERGRPRAGRAEARMKTA